jgi:hypothetical protein
MTMGRFATALPGAAAVVIKAGPYAHAAALVKSDVLFDDFPMSVKMGDLVFNLHTEAVRDGEISGEVDDVGGAPMTH